MGYCCAQADMELIKECFGRTVSRGPDDTRYVTVPDGVLGFHRLSIMGLTDSGMQPFRLGDSYVVCNGELYGFEKQKAELVKMGYTFESDSDCEILLPMYREYGTRMFSMLDAEFACIIYDASTHEFIAARDPIGIRPLYYGYDENGVLAFASEPQNLIGIALDIKPFPPGYYCVNGEFTRYCDIAGDYARIRAVGDVSC